MTCPLLSRVRTIAVKAEAVPGTKESLLAANATINVFDPIIQQTAEMVDRDQQGGMGYLPAVPDSRLGTCTFTTELIADSLIPLWATVLLPACGIGDDTGGVFSMSVIPPGCAGATQHTITIGMYENGLFKCIYGAMGNVKFTMVSGKRVSAEFTFTGIWAEPTDVAILAPTYPAAPVLRFVDSAFQIGTWTPRIEMLTIDTGNNVIVREDSTTDSGYSYAVIANRRPVGTINPEATLVATKDIFGEWIGGTEAAFSAACGSGDDSVTFTAGGCQWLNPQEGDRNGLAINAIDFGLNDDDLTVTLDTTSATTFAP